jgi:hypothetical protein
MQSQSSTKKTPPCRLRHRFDSSTKYWFSLRCEKRENKKLPGVLPHSYSESFVPFCDTDEGEKQITLLDGFGFKEVDPKSLPTFIPSCSRFLQT